MRFPRTPACPSSHSPVCLRARHDALSGTGGEVAESAAAAGKVLLIV
jgi:hypothetical protein